MWTTEQVPILRILLPFMVGIIIVGYFPALSTRYILFAMLGVGILLLSYILNTYFQSILWLAFILLGMAIMGKADDASSIQPTIMSETMRIAVIKDKIKKSDRGLQFDLVMLPGGVKLKAFTDINKYVHEYRIGDTLIFTSSLSYPSEASTPWGFDYRNYLERQNVYFTTYIMREQIREHRNFQGFSVARIASDWEKKAVGILDRLMPEGTNIPLIISVTFGDKASLDRTLMNRMKSAGLLHIMAVSGFHIVVIYMFLGFLTYPLKKYKKLKNLIILIGVWLFIFICGSPASAVRAGIMLSVYEIGKLLAVKPHKFNVLAISAFLILLFDPFQIFQIGFQFSFLAIAGIFFFFDKIEAFILGLVAMPKTISSSLSLSFAAQAILIPLCLYYFGFVSYWFWLWSLVAVPLTIAIMVGALVVIGLDLLTLSTISALVAYIPFLGSEGLEIVAYLQSLLPVKGLIVHIPWFFMLGLLLLLLIYIGREYFSIKTGKIVLVGSFIWLLCFSIYRTYIKLQDGVYVFSAYENNHILVKNGDSAVLIGDSLSYTTKINLQAYLGVKNWRFYAADLFHNHQLISIKSEEGVYPIANLTTGSAAVEQEDELPILYRAAPWDPMRKEDYAINISRHYFTYLNQ